MLEDEANAPRRPEILIYREPDVECQTVFGKTATSSGVRAALLAWQPPMPRPALRVAAIEASLPSFDRLHFGGHHFARGTEFAEAIARIAGRPDLSIRPASWSLVHLGAPFFTFFRQLLEMRYLWQQDLQLVCRLTAVANRARQTKGATTARTSHESAPHRATATALPLLPNSARFAVCRW